MPGDSYYPGGRRPVWVMCHGSQDDGAIQCAMAAMMARCWRSSLRKFSGELRRAKPFEYMRRLAEGEGCMRTWRRISSANVVSCFYFPLNSGSID